MNKLSNTKTLTIAAMLTAIGIVLGLYKLPISQLIEIRFSSLPLSVAGMMLGPWIAGVVGALIDIGGFLVYPTGAFFPGFTLSAVLSGIVFGIMLHDKKITIARVFITELIITVFINLLLNSFWLDLMYFSVDGHVTIQSYFAAISTRFPKEAIMLFVNTAMLYALLKAFKSIKIGARA
ncbi:MAG: folate family ECF transporter S component [Pseudobutyrivibrio sp.]|nr:folate family ECF transporter S component [Pseudobutyrivibrio sp.]